MGLEEGSGIRREGDRERERSSQDSPSWQARKPIREGAGKQSGKRPKDNHGGQSQRHRGNIESATPTAIGVGTPIPYAAIGSIGPV
jgi:hypothetical protein